jgi:hypothetical protein
MSVTWTRDELNILRTHYNSRGCEWDGWRSLLPNRTNGAIRHKAFDLGIKSERDAPRAAPPRRRKPMRSRMYIADGSERYVLAKLKDGLTPSEIDKTRRWTPGRTKMILMEMWRREWE